MTIVSDSPSCGITYDCHSDNYKLSIKLLNRRGKRKVEGEEGSVTSHLNSDVIVGLETATDFNKRLMLWTK
jgi:hypothetical protein